MGSSAGHESSRQCKTIKAEARINRQSGFADLQPVFCFVLFCFVLLLVS